MPGLPQLPISHQSLVHFKPLCEEGKRLPSENAANADLVGRKAPRPHPAADIRVDNIVGPDQNETHRLHG